MKIKPNSASSRKKIIIVATLLLLTALAAVFLLYLTSNKNEGQDSESGSTAIQKPPTDDAQKGLTPSETLPENSQSLTTQEVPISKTGTATISRLEQNGSMVHFEAIVTNAESLGKCVVTFSTPNDKPIAKEFDSKKQGNSYVCALETSALEFSYIGEWDATLRYYDGENQITTKGSIRIS